MAGCIPLETSRWILLLSVCDSLALADSSAPAVWHETNGGRWCQASPTAGNGVGFTLLKNGDLGIAFTNHLSETAAVMNRILENGSGVALGDVDGDGRCDIYLCRMEGGNVLYRNMGGWKFVDITESAGVACAGQFSTGAVFADLDGDGDLDLLVNSIGGGTREFLNDGHGHFKEVTDSRLVHRFGSTSLALADIDGDGDLDLYVTNYRTTTYRDRPAGLKVEASMVDGKVVVTPTDRFLPAVQRAGAVEVIERGERDFLYVNDGQGHFLPVSWTAGSFLDEDGHPLTEPPQDWGLSVMFRDINGDGLPDIYVCNDFCYSPDRIYLNEDGRRFRAAPRHALRHMSMSSMGVDFADVNRDGLDDFFVSDMLSRHSSWRHRQRPELIRGFLPWKTEDPEARPEESHNSLFFNRGDGTYAEIAQLSGVEATEWSWGCVFLDVDLDGYEDLIIPTGNMRDVQDADVRMRQSSKSAQNGVETRLASWREFPPIPTPILAYRNNHDLTFTEMGNQWGFTSNGVHNGLALADLDNDGDLDIVVNSLNGAPVIYRNEASAPRVGVRLRGLPGNTRGIGAKIRVFGGPVVQSQEMICGGRYLSCDDTMRVFAAGTPTNRLRVEVTWRSGKRTVVDQVSADRIYEIDESAAAIVPIQGAENQTSSPHGEARTPWFKDVSALLQHWHSDTPYDDFERQPMLSRKFSHLGPGVAWFDFDGDGWDDLIIGSGRDGRIGVFHNQGTNGFGQQPAPELESTRGAEQATVMGWPSSSSSRRLLVSVSNYEKPALSRPSVVAVDLSSNRTEEFAPAMPATVGPMALADLDGKGNLDLFVGGRLVPGSYPAAASSRLYRNLDGKVRLDEESSRLFSGFGMVNGAVFSDLDGDGHPELLLACDWGPIHVLRYQSGRFVEITAELGLAPYTGWWNGVTVADVNGDGKLDIVAVNWGRNTRWQRFLAKPLKLYYGDFGNGSGADLIETHFDPEEQKWNPWRDYETMCQSLPWLREKCSTFRAYGVLGAQELLGDRFKTASCLQAQTLDSMVFLNRGDHFEAHPLPAEAQFAPGFGVAVADFDNDGHEDLFIAQNFFDVEQGASRYDGGVGLVLVGDGLGGFSALSPSESGISVMGEQRGCAVGDYDRDGKMDLVVAQNRGQTRLFQNLSAKPGLRVRLKGPPGNPLGVGAQLRAASNGHLGPVRELHAGSGYLSQDSAVAVLARPEEPAQIHVRWPGGKAFTLDLPAHAREVEVSYEGTIALLQ